MRTPNKGTAPRRGFCSVLSVVAFLVLGYGSFLVYLHQSRRGSGSAGVVQAQTEEHPKEAALAKARPPKRQTPAPPPPPPPPPSSLAPREDGGSGGEGEVHVVFSTDCSFYQDWQTLLVFYTAGTVGQKGRITRIASGCEESKKETLRALYKKLYPQYDVHFTPDFKKDPKTKAKYDFYNKPFGVQHWLRHNPQVKSGTVVAIIDPDMIFLRPLTTQIIGQDNNLFMRGFDAAKEPIPAHVGKGHPAAQLYGLGAPWADDHHRHFNRTEACGAGSPCLKVVPRYGERHYSVGPPYLVEKDDLVRLTDTWVRMVPLVYGRYPELLAEMYAYSMAAAHENLPHLTMTHHMVSNTEAHDEGWAWVDKLQDRTCEPAIDGKFYPGKPMPSMLHYCQFFRVGEWGFQKRRVPKKMFECEGFLLGDIPRDIALTKYKNRDGEIIPITRTYARRNAFMLCGIHSSINALLRDYKARVCVGDKAAAINLNASLNLAKALHW